MNQDDDLQTIAKGLKLAQALLRSAAAYDDKPALDAINNAEPNELRQAIAYLLSGVRDVFEEVYNGDRTRVTRELRAAADNVDQVIVANQLRLMSGEFPTD